MTPLEEAIGKYNMWYRERYLEGEDQDLTSIDTAINPVIEAAEALQEEFDTAMVLVRDTIDSYKRQQGQPKLKAVSLTDYRAELRKVGRQYLEKQ